MALESSITILENIYSTGITHDDRHMMIIKMFIIQATGAELYNFYDLILQVT
jgi:hypothetical protein